MIESTGSMGRSATYAEELFVAEIERLKQENEKLSKRLSGALQHLEEAREGRAAAIDRLTPLGCENERLRDAMKSAERLFNALCFDMPDWVGRNEGVCGPFRVALNGEIRTRGAVPQSDKA